MNHNNESPLFENPQKPQNKLFSTSIRGTIFVCILLICTWGGYTAYKHSSTYMQKQEAESIAQGQIERGKELQSLYQNEGSPLINNEATNISTDTTVSTQEPSGFLVFTAATVVKNPRTQLYVIDASGPQSTSSLLFPKMSTLNGLIEFKNKLSPKSFFMLGIGQGEVSPASDSFSTFSFVNASSTGSELLGVAGNLERNFEWSETAKLLAFNKTAEEQKDYIDMVSIDNWEIVVVNPEDTVKSFTIKGAHSPRWTPDGKRLIYLKKDGLYMYTLGEMSEELILEVGQGSSVITTAMIDISSDGKTLIWSTAKDGIINVLSVDSWSTERPTFSLIQKIDSNVTEFYHPVMSPNGLFFAIQAIDKTNNEGFRTNPRMEIRRIDNSTVLRSYPLKSFNFDAMFTDVWVEKLPQ